MNTHDLARLYVIRWARYRNSQLVQGKRDKSAEAKRLASKVGLNPIPTDPEPDVTRVMAIIVGEALNPTPQEAYLSVELLGKIYGFTRWRYLAEKSLCPRSFWESDMPGNLAETHAGAKSFMEFLASALVR